MRDKPSNGLSISIQTIDPILARLYLDAHENYRTVNKRRMAAYSRAMKADNWKLSILIFDQDGILVDGQTRLEALINAGVAEEFAVVAGWPSEATVTLDNNQARTKGQTLKASIGVKNATRVASLAQNIKHLFDSDFHTNMEVTELATKYGSVINKVTEVQGHSAVKAALHGLPYCRALVCFPDREVEILDALRCLRDLDFHEPRTSGLKQYYLAYVSGSGTKIGGTQRKDVYLRGARALQAYLNNEEIKHLIKPNVDPFEIYI